MSTNIQTSKSILAKLLATENITVSHQQTKTAYFDLKSRTMVLPIWKDMDGDLYDLLTGHEVGHALNTPQQGWHDQVASSSKKYKNFLNVIEDARIEKLVKRKFPGLAKAFARAYASLYERDFFGIKKLGDLNKLNLIDRINLRFKMGAHVVVEFNDVERDIVREVENAETWDQVVNIAQRVYDYVKEHEQNKVQNKNDLMDAFAPPQTEDGDSEMESEDSFDEEDDEFRDGDEASDSADSDEESDLGEESDGEDSDSTDESEEESDSDEEETSSKTVNNGDSEDDGEPHSVTDQIFRQRESELVNSSGKVFMYNLPEANLENIILPNTEVMNDLERYFREQVADRHKPYGRNGVSYETVVQKSVRRFNAANKKVIMHILKEFEMRKKASEYARTQTARTGELNLNVLHKYKFSSDLFKKISVVPKGKNHGYILFVDMSGSMCDLIRNTIDQMLILVSFCKLANVPVEVYGFSDDAYGNKKLVEMRNSERFVSEKFTDIVVGQDWFHLKHLIGTSLSPVQYRKAFNMLCVISSEYIRYGAYRHNHVPDGEFNDWDRSGFGLNGTPFIQTLLVSREIINRFQRHHHLHVCNVVYLTDGEGGNDVSYPPDENRFHHVERDAVYYLVDKKTKKKIKMANPFEFQKSITQLVADVTGCKHIGFYIGNPKAIKRDMKFIVYDKSFEEQQAIRNSFNRHNFFTTKNLGYEKYFYVGIPSDNVTDEKLNITQDMSKNKMAKVFGDNLNSKRTNRLLLTKLAEELAVA